MRHFWLDRILEMEVGRHAVGIKCFTLSEDFFNEHFPGNPVVPGVYLLEGLAQTAGVLLALTTERRKFALMVSVDRAKFSNFARPGEEVRLAVTIEDMGDDHARVHAVATAGERQVARAGISFRLLETGKLIPEQYRPYWNHMLDVWSGIYPGEGDG